MSRGFIVERGKYGNKLVLRGEWHPKIAAEMRKRGIEELEVNYARGFPGDSIAFLEELPFLKFLLLITYWVKDITPIHALHELRAVDIGSRGEKSKLDFSQFPALRDCGLEWHPGCESVFGCHTLERLWINKYPGHTADSFASLTNLEKLYIGSSPVRSLTGLAALANLRVLGIYYLRQLESLRGIDGLMTLEELDVRTCRKIASIEEIRGLRKLRRFILENCGDIATMEPIRGLPDLQEVYFAESTNVLDGDLSPLVQLPKLRRISFQDRRHYNLRLDDFPQWAAMSQVEESTTGTGDG